MIPALFVLVMMMVVVTVEMTAAIVVVVTMIATNYLATSLAFYKKTGANKVTVLSIMSCYY
jgi:hypothetical protein